MKVLLKAGFIKKVIGELEKRTGSLELFGQEG